MRILTLLFAVLIGSAAFAHGPNRPFDFRENLGQWEGDFLFRATRSNADLFIEEKCFTWNIIHPDDFLAIHDVIKDEAALASFVLRSHAFKVHFEGANTPNIVPQEQNATYYNYYLGNDPSKWAVNVGSYNAVRYSGLWDGVGMRVYRTGESFKYDFIVNAGADASQIVLRYEGVDGLVLEDGKLLVETSVGQLIESAPFAYQMNGTQMDEVACHFTVDGDLVRFVFPEGFDTSRNLIIDPEVIASTLSGTTGTSNYGHCATYDIEGNIYTGAINFGGGYPTTTGAVQTAFPGGGISVSLSKLNPDGTDLIWASYLGGNGSDYPHSLIANNLGELYAYGSTSSSNFPTTTGAYDTSSNGASDIFVSRISADGTALMGSTYMGGAAADGSNTLNINYGDTYRGEIILDSNERPVVASFSGSTNFPTSSGAYQSSLAGGQDAVLFSLSAALTNLVYSTYYGGSGNDAGYGVRTNVDGTIYMVGGTESNDLPTTPGAYATQFLGGEPGWGGGGGQDGFIARFNPFATQLQAATYWATDENDQVFFIDLDNDDDVWVYGQSAGDIPVTAGTYSETGGPMFISKFTPMLNALTVGSSVAASPNGFGNPVPVAFLVDRCDNVYVSMYSAPSTGLALTDDAVFTTGGFYLAAYGPDLETLEFATYYTGNHVDGGTSRFDKSGIIYQGVCSGGGFNVLPGSWSNTQAGWDIAVFKMDFQVAGVNASLTASAEALNGCAPHTVDFSNFSVGNIFTWDFGDGSPESNEFEPSHTYTEPGLYTVQLISMDSLSCNIADTAYVDIAVSVPQDFNPTFEYDIDCESFTVTTNNTTDAPWLQYTWDMGDGTILEGENITHIYAEEGEYTISLLAEDLGCENDEAVEEVVSIGATVLATVEPSSLFACESTTVDFQNTSNGVTYLWDFGDGSPTTTDVNPTHTFNGPGQYEVSLTAFDPETCNLEDQVTLTVTVTEGLPIDAAFQLLQTDCEQLTVEGTDLSEGEFLQYTWDMGDGTEYTTANIEHSYASTGQYDVTLTILDEACDQTDTFTLPVNILTELTAVIGNSDLSECAPYTVQFINNSAGNSFTWDFGDGSDPVNGQLVEHTYTIPGTYTVTLLVEGAESCGGSDQTTAEVVVIEPPFIEALFSAEQFGACEAVSVNFTDESTGEDLIYAWTIEGTNYAIPNPQHIFSGEGNYPISLTVSEALCDQTSSFTDVIQVLGGIDIVASPDQYFCYYETQTTVTVAGPADAEYEWSTGDTGTSLVVNSVGEYSITATLNNCNETRVINVIPVPELSLYDNPVACEGTQAALRIPYENGSNYQWCDGGGETTLIYADQPGEYCYEFTDEFGCLQTGTVVLDIIEREIGVYVPNAFTPNNDGVNDVFKVEGVGISDFEFRVWNRWGDKVFETDNPESFWDGSYQGGTHYTQNEVYTWEIEYESTCNAERIKRSGYVVMMR